jgi:Tol biopolymer transport system component/DNA-binding winged helix-turn-helix (wHTH) protein
MTKPNGHFYEFGPFCVDTRKRLLLRGGQTAPITPKAFDILLALIENRDEALSKDELMQAVWRDTVVEENNLTRNISTLRRALGERPNEHQYVVTIPGRGYQFVADVREFVVEDSHAAVERAGRAEAASEKAFSTLRAEPDGKNGNGRRFKVFSLSALSLLIVSATYILLWPPRFDEKIPFQNIEMTRLTNARSVRGVISPDGNHIVYWATENGRQGLWRREIATDNIQELVKPDKGIYHDLALSPDGDYAYFVRSSEKESALRALYRVSLFGGATVKLIEDLNGKFTLSPDGKQVAFRRDYNSQEKCALIIANVDGSDERRLATRPLSEPYGYPAWAPNGETIVCSIGNAGREGDHMGIAEVRLEDGAERFLTPQKWFVVREKAWLRDGSGLLFDAQMAGNPRSQIWRLSYPGGEARQVANGLDNCGAMSLTADSKTMTCSQREFISDIWLAPEGDASRARNIGVGGGSSWTPDGRIVYDSMVSGARDLWIMNQDGTDRKKLTSGPGAKHSPKVTPDGRHIVFTSNRTGAVQIWRMDIDGDNHVQLTHGSGARWCDVSPDGKWVVYTAVDDESIWKVPVAGGEPVRGASGHYAYRPSVSPDGKLIAYHHKERRSSAKYKIAVIPFEGGQPVRMFDPPRDDFSTWDIIWTADGKALLYEAVHNGASNIWRQPLDGGPHRQLTNFRSDSIFSFSRSRDGKHLICSRGGWISDLVRVRDLSGW